MQAKVITIPTGTIVDWDTFHDAFEEALGFPSFYGRNMNAWIDCLSDADDPEGGMIADPVARGELLTLSISDAPAFRKRCPEQYDALIECAAFVNFQRVEEGDDPFLALLIEGWFSSFK